MVVVGVERRLLNGLWYQLDLVEVRAQIDLGEDSHAVQLIEDIVQRGNWEGIFYRDAIQHCVVYTEAPGSILLAHQDDRRRVRRLSRPDYTFFQHSRNQTPHFLILESSVFVRANLDRSDTRVEHNRMISRTTQWQTLRWGKVIRVVSKDDIKCGV